VFSKITLLISFIATCYMTLRYQSQIYPTGYHPKSLVTGDFNGDSAPDIAVTNYEDHSFSVLLGNGDGTFQTQQIYSTGDGSYPWGIATADFNNDMLLDLSKLVSLITDD